MKLQYLFAVVFMFLVGGFGFCQDQRLVFEKLPVKKLAEQEMLVGRLDIQREYLYSPQSKESFVESKKLGGQIHQVLAINNGDLLVATSNGAYRIGGNGKMTVAEEGRDCRALAVSPDGDIALAFIGEYRPRIWVSTFGGEKTEVVEQKKGYFAEIRILGKKARSVYFPSLMPREYARGPREFITHLAFNKAGVIAALFYPEGLVVLDGENCWLTNQPGSLNHISFGLQFDVKDSNSLLCAEYAYHLNLSGGGAIRSRLPGAGDVRHNTVGQIIPSGIIRFDPAGKTVSVTRENGKFFLLDQATKKPVQMGFSGMFEVVPSHLAVNDNYVAWAILDTMFVFDRKQAKFVGSFQQVADTGERWDLLKRYVHSICWRPSGELIIATGNGEISEWDAATVKKKRVIVSPR